MLVDNMKAVRVLPSLALTGALTGGRMVVLPPSAPHTASEANAPDAPRGS